jgi:S1/P1 Nuclease
VVDKINEFRLVIKDKNKTIEERRFALRFLVHCLQDMHQPCHVGDNKDRGGNDTQVRLFDKGTDMHRLWDTELLAQLSPSEDAWFKSLAALSTPDVRAAAMKGTVED